MRQTKLTIGEINGLIDVYNDVGDDRDGNFISSESEN